MKKGSFADFLQLVRQSRREAALVALASLILLSITGFSFWLTRRVWKDVETVDQLHAFNAKLTVFVQYLRTVESSQRGYIITGDKDFLVPYDTVSGKFATFMDELRDSAPQGSDIARKVEALSQPLEAKLKEMAHTVSLVKSGDRDAAIAIVENGFGRDLMVKIEDDVHAVQEQAQAHIKENEAGTIRLQNIKLIIDGVGTALVISFSFLSLLLLLRSNAASREAKAVLAVANADLEDTVAERTAALKRANSEIQRFAYIVSHDLRSPLVNIMGFTAELETLRTEIFEKLAAANALSGSETLSKDFDEAFGFIKSSIARMDRLIAAILKISREGSRPLRPEPVDMNPLVNGIIAGVEHQIREKEATVIIGDLPPLVADRLALEQIFSNLIENAIKFLKPGSKGEIRVEGKRLDSEIVYMVSDDGRGIDHKDHQRIFELFRRAGPQDVPGEGMGLAYVSALVRRLGGTIAIVSALGEGSTFKLTLPNKAALQGRKAA